MRNGRPPRDTSASPLASISGRASVKSAATWAGSKGAAMVTTAAASGTRPAAARTADPPRLWPMRIFGA